MRHISKNKISIVSIVWINHNLATSVVANKVNASAAMRSATRRNFATATALSLALLQLLLFTSEAFKQAVHNTNLIASLTKCRTHQPLHPLHKILSLRGGDDDSSSTLDVEIDVDEIESSDEEEEDEDEDVEEKLDPKLVRAAQAASSKVKAKAVKAATKSAKAAIASTLLANKPKEKKEKSGLAKLFHLPYIVKACLNPFIFLQMTKEYWKSLLNYKYGEAVKV